MYFICKKEMYVSCSVQHFDSRRKREKKVEGREEGGLRGV